MFKQFAAQNRATNEFGYTNLTGVQTQELITAISILLDRVYETHDNVFQKYVVSRVEEREDDPLEMFSKFFSVLEGEHKSKYQNQFYNFCKANIESIFKWYRKNGERVNMSPRQTEWFKRWFLKHGVDCQFLKENNK
jgi:hypothetical protein